MVRQLKKIQQYLFILFIFTIFPFFSFCQSSSDTLSEANYTQKALAISNSMGQSLSLSGSQVDSVNQIFQDYLLGMIHLKSSNVGTRGFIESLNILKAIREKRLEANLNKEQYDLLIKNRKVDQQKMISKMDSIYNNHH